MSKGMYHIEGPCPDNEVLVLRLQDGDELAATMLLSQNENYLTSVAKRLLRQCKNSGALEDLKQEGALALLDAARRYRYDSGAKFLTYAAKDIHADGSPGRSLSQHPPGGISYLGAEVRLFRK